MTEVSIDVCGLFGIILLIVYFVIDRFVKWRRGKK
jgi:hypothetical protein